MKQITMMEFRASPGEFLDEVRRRGKSFVITKGGKPAARLVPMDDVIRIDGEGDVVGERPFTFRHDFKKVEAPR